MVIIGKTENYIPAAGRPQNALKVPHRPGITARGAVGPGIAKGRKVGGNMPHGPARPGVGCRAVAREQGEHAFEISVQDRAGKSMTAQCSGNLRDACRRFRGFGYRGEDEEHEALCRIRILKARTFKLFAATCKKQGFTAEPRRPQRTHHPQYGSWNHRLTQMKNKIRNIHHFGVAPAW